MLTLQQIESPASTEASFSFFSSDLNVTTHHIPEKLQSRLSGRLSCDRDHSYSFSSNTEDFIHKEVNICL